MGRLAVRPARNEDRETDIAESGNVTGHRGQLQHPDTERLTCVLPPGPAMIRPTKPMQDTQMRILALAGLLALSAPFQALADAIPGTEYASGYWTGAAYTDDTGAFFYCDVSVSYTNGEVLWLGLYNNDTLAVLLSHPEVRFQPGETFDSWLMLETGPPIRQEAEAWDENYAGMTLQGIDSTIEFLTAGQWLRQVGFGIDEAYDVTGIREALGMAQACHGRNSGSNPFATADPAPADPVAELPAAELPAEPAAEPIAEPVAEPEVKPALGTPRPLPKVPDLTPKPGGGLGTKPGGALGTPAPKPAP